MSFLPSIPKHKKNNKTIKFSNPLLGVVFDNHNYLKTSHIQATPQSQKPIPRYHRKSKSVLYYPQTKSPSKTKIQRDCSFFRQSTISQDYETLTKRSNSPQKIKKISAYPDIEIKFLKDDPFYKNKIKERNITTNFGYFFNTFFRTKNIGEEDINKEFLNFIQSYIRILNDQGKLKTDLNISNFPQELFHLRNKEEIINKIGALQRRNSHKAVQAIIRFYCVPLVQYRESLLRDIMLMIKKQLEKQLDFDKQGNYVLLNREGRVIKDVTDIYFSTTVLYITPEERHSYLYKSYVNSCIYNQSIIKQINFNQDLKKSFRRNITKGNYQNYQKDYKTIQTDTQGRKNAQSIVNSRRSQKSLKLYQPGESKVKRKQKQTLKSQVKQVSNSVHKYKEEFLKMKLDNEEGVKLSVFMKTSQLFKNKTHEHVKRILSSLGISIQDEFIFEEDWIRLKQISQCEGKRYLILLFLRQFMNFDKNQNLSRQNFSQMMRTIRQKGDRKDLQEIIWLWLQKHSLIDDNKFSGNLVLQEWKQKYKFIIEFFISLIFGIKETKIIELTYQVLI